MWARLLRILPHRAEEKQAKEADVHVRAVLSAHLRCAHTSASANGASEPLTSLSSADAYRSRKLSCKAPVSLRCALCRRRFRLWPSMLQPNECPADVTPTTNSLHGSDGSIGSDSSGSSMMVCSRDDASSVASAARHAAAGLKQWDLCWAKVGDWPYW